MARGWESKAVEDQIASAEADKNTRSSTKTVLTQRDREKQAKKEALLLSRTNVVNRINATRNERYRAQLELALEHLESKLRELEQTS